MTSSGSGIVSGWVDRWEMTVLRPALWKTSMYIQAWEKEPTWLSLISPALQTFSFKAS